MRCWCSISSFFFFSSRRRHTRFDCDWSSDVCSSDLAWVDEQRKIAAAKKDDPSKVWSLPDLMARGEKVYAANCAACHQANGKGAGPIKPLDGSRSEEHTSELQSQSNLVCRLLLEKKKERKSRDSTRPSFSGAPSLGQTGSWSIRSANSRGSTASRYSRNRQRTSGSPTATTLTRYNTS